MDLKLSIKILFICICILNVTACRSQSLTMKKELNSLKTGFENDKNTTATYHQTIAFYEKLGDLENAISVNPVGMTDSGFPLHEVIISKDSDFDPSSIRAKGKVVLFLNNAIHPGEPCGVDASMMLARDLFIKDELAALLDNTVIILIPFYNIGGGLNRGSFSRANQEGPEYYGFRGNAKNLDLNRDFIKCDSENAKTFNKLYNKWSPDVFIDNHTSNGADYQYSMTLIATQKDKLQEDISQYMVGQMLPDLFQKMKSKNWEMTPYVYAQNTPDDGIMGFLDLPRYSSGYAALHNAISFMPETHMLKPYTDRVESTYAFMISMLEHLSVHAKQVLDVRKNAVDKIKAQIDFPIEWELDREKVDKVFFKGYEAKYKKSLVTGLDRMYYDQSAPWEKEIDFLNSYKDIRAIAKPKAYVFPQAYKELAERLEWNGVKVERLKEDLNSEFEMYYIQDYESVKQAYEGHYLHYNVEVNIVSKKWKYNKGDFIVYTGQNSDRYIVECLEPQAADSYFAWNFFDGILMQKEYFSSYVFEEIAADLLANDQELKNELEKKKREDAEFAGNARAQLSFIYKKSPHYEQTHKLYPVARIVK